MSGFFNHLPLSEALGQTCQILGTAGQQPAGLDDDLRLNNITCTSAADMPVAKVEPRNDFSNIIGGPKPTGMA